MKREQYIDVIKGISILFVIYYHFLIDGISFRESPTKEFFETICMQLFFFVSGYLAYRSDRKYTWNYTKDAILKKMRYILIPSILMFIFSIFYFGSDIRACLTSDLKNGYWFTYVLFFIYVIFYLTSTLTRRDSSKSRLDIIFFGISIVIGFASVFVKYFDSQLVDILSLRRTMKFLMFFMLGYFYHKYCIYDFLKSKGMLRGLFFILSLVPTHLIPESKFKYSVEFVVSICRVLVCFYFFSYSDAFKLNNFVTTQLSLLGRHSLEIYFIHFYFLFGMPMLLSYLQEQSFLFVGRGPGATFPIELLAILPLSVFIAYLCVLTRRLFDIFAPPISELFFGMIHKD